MVKRSIATIATIAVLSMPLAARPAPVPALLGGADANAVCYLFSTFQAAQPNVVANRQKILSAIVGFYAARMTAGHPDDAGLKNALSKAQTALLAKRDDAAFTKLVGTQCFEPFNGQMKRILTITSSGAKKP
jgi:hypothetical protein